MLPGNKFFLPALLTIFRIVVYISSTMFVLAPYVFADESILLDPVIITSTRIDSEAGKTRIPTRSQDSIIPSGEERLSYFSIPSILEDFSLTDVRTRGPYGVQADISLRGAPFEENLVLLDGININDPQTGHHNMDLPLTLYDVERIDVTYGPASSVYGSGAIGGAVNIIPRSPRDEPGFYVSSSTGSWDFYSGSASLNVPMGAFKNRSSLEWKRSTGFRPETEFDSLTASSYSEAELGYAKFSVLLGYLTKKFGAADFYSSRFPDEEESVNTGLLIARADIKKNGVSIAPNFYWKRMQDKFILDRNRPFFSRNDHTTNLYGGEITAQVETDLGKLAFGGGVGEEEISSTNLGGHSRVKTDAFLEYEHRIARFFLNVGARFDYYSTFKSEFCPSLNVGYEIFEELTIRAGAARAFRAPTFTDLYYRTAANMGNPDLNPETAWSYDTGFNYTTPGIAASGTVFLRNAKSVIDWTKSGPTSAWQAENIGSFDMYGLESFLRFEFEKFTDTTFFKSLSLRYAYLEGLDKKGIASKYVLEYLKHNLNLALECDLPFGFTEQLNFSFKKRIGHEKYFLLDSTLYKDVELPEGNMTLFLKLNNIFNTAYDGEGDVEMPGFAITGGGSVQF